MVNSQTTAAALTFAQRISLMLNAMMVPTSVKNVLKEVINATLLLSVKQLVVSLLPNAIQVLVNVLPVIKEKIKTAPKQSQHAIKNAQL